AAPPRTKGAPRRAQRTAPPLRLRRGRQLGPAKLNRYRQLVYSYMLLYGKRRVGMAKNTSISLDEHFSTFVDRQLAGGRYGSASEVVRAGLRLLEEHEARLDALRAALIVGERSGPSEPFDFDNFIKEKRLFDPG
ncbi:MAG: type II toxin-antitoxin system ParD family antitoxin, partial [Stellaceae bacterium]